jgi:glycine/serine hydroxymethyltransferase
MKSGEMEDVARFFARALIEGEDPSSVKADVREFKSQFQTVHYCFEPGPAYPGL